MDAENDLDNLLKRYRIPLAMGLIGAVLLIGGVFSSGIASQSFVKSSPSTAKISPTLSRAQIALVKVDVSGSVQNPGVYSLPSGSRVEDAVKAAGGISSGVNEVYLSKSVNLAQKLSDGMKIYIPSKDENSGAGTSQQMAGTGTSLVNINDASVKELDTLPGVGEVTAESIIDKRPFSNIEELLLKKAVNRSVYENIKDLVSI